MGAPPHLQSRGSKSAGLLVAMPRSLWQSPAAQRSAVFDAEELEHTMLASLPCVHSQRPGRALAVAVFLLMLTAGCQHQGVAPRPATSEQVETIRAYYQNLFEAAQTVTIRSFHDPEFAKIVTRANQPEAFARIESAVANGFVKPYPCQCLVHWRLDVLSGDGSETKDINVCHYLRSPDQPFGGKFWFFPLPPGESEKSPGIINEIDRLAGRKPWEESSREE